MASMTENSTMNSTLNRTNLGTELADRLDENYLFLLNFVDGCLNELQEDGRNLARKWLEKLGTDTESLSVSSKLKRNSYLGKLITCMQEKHFDAPFNAPPPSGDLPAVNWELPHLEHAEWVDRLVQGEANKTHVGGKNFETYVSTKVFENGRGSCAYVAVSVKNEGDKSAWVKIQPNQHKNIQRMFAKEIRKHMN
jgi:Domain of unknown function (DUF4485)